ncbi:MAG TPA: amidohydrolase [Bacteroidales bacterium]|nr:amidohydrolase [Bacteroidales bacterium]
MKKTFFLAAFLLISISGIAQDKLKGQIESIIERIEDEHFETYKFLHSHPEVSLMEYETAKKMASHLEDLGFKVTRNFSGNSLVGVFENGNGPVIMLRTDMDALPIKEQTDLPYASSVIMKDASGKQVPAMHACGHDMHMTLWLGTLNTMVTLKNEWSGTIIAIAQQAEEVSGGAIKMIEDGLFRKFPVPDYALAYHVNPELPAGSIGYYPGPIFGGVSSVDIHVFGYGGHGAMPHTTIDPVVLASRIVLAIQTLVSREIEPIQPAVVTVGSIHGGSKHNIIPDRVDMQLTVRFFSDEVYNQIIDGLKRITRGIALSAGLTEEKFPEVIPLEGLTPPVANNPDLVNKGVVSMEKMLGSDLMYGVKPSTVGEDFGKYGRTPEKIPIALFWLGGVEKDKYLDHIENGTPLPGLHNAAFYPDFYPTFKGGVAAMARTMIDLFNE